MVTILLVDDNDLNRQMLSRRLQTRDYEVITANDGQKGIELAQQKQPALILMDMSLPVLDGWSAVEILKSEDATAGIPIIGFTAHAISGDRDRCLEVGCSDYESKPVNFPQLLKKIDALLA